jgi:predicted ABC-type sugar transport system permease subunit
MCTRYHQLQSLQGRHAEQSLQAVQMIHLLLLHLYVFNIVTATFFVEHSIVSECICACVCVLKTVYQTICKV